jgi:hypothetical protein
MYPMAVLAVLTTRGLARTSHQASPGECFAIPEPSGVGVAVRAKLAASLRRLADLIAPPRVKARADAARSWS